MRAVFRTVSIELGGECPHFSFESTEGAETMTVDSAMWLGRAEYEGLYTAEEAVEVAFEAMAGDYMEVQNCAATIAHYSGGQGDPWKD